MGYNRFYYWKKAYALFPGVRRPISAPILAEHYRRRSAGRSPARAWLDAVAGLLFHLWLPWRAWTVQKRYGLGAHWRRRALRIAHARFADPNDIALFRIEDARELDTYIRRFEDAALNKRINPAGWSAGCVLADKRLFAERCAASGLPHPQTVALVDHGTVTLLAEPAGRPLVAKPADGEGGSGILMLGPIADRDELRAALLPSTMPKGLLVVQPRIEIHPALADLALSALPTVRVVTMFDERGAPEVVSATFRCPTDPEACVDNMKAGGLIAAVDLETGTLGPACKGYGGGDHTVHPITKAPIQGRILPDWKKVRSLAIRAHAAFPAYALIGWDIAITPPAPMLIEGNGKPGVLMPQRAARSGLAQGRYGALLAYHLQHSSPIPATGR